EQRARAIAEEKGLTLEEIGVESGTEVAGAGPGVGAAAPSAEGTPDGHANGTAAGKQPAPGAERRPVASMRELHENRELEKIFENLRGFGVAIEDYALVQEESVTGERLPTRYAWEMREEGTRARGHGTTEGTEG